MISKKAKKTNRGTYDLSVFIIHFSLEVKEEGCKKLLLLWKNRCNFFHGWI